MISNLAQLAHAIESLREPAGGYDEVLDRFSNIAFLDHERKIQYREVVNALQFSDRHTPHIILAGIREDFTTYGAALKIAARNARDLDGHGNVLCNSAPISLEDQAMYEHRCSELRARVLNALLASGLTSSDPDWLL